MDGGVRVQVLYAGILRPLTINPKIRTHQVEWNVCQILARVYPSNWNRVRIGVHATMWHF